MLNDKLKGQIMKYARISKFIMLEGGVMGMFQTIIVIVVSFIAIRRYILGEISLTGIIASLVFFWIISHIFSNLVSDWIISLVFSK